MANDFEWIDPHEALRSAEARARTAEGNYQYARNDAHKQVNEYLNRGLKDYLDEAVLQIAEKLVAEVIEPAARRMIERQLQHLKEATLQHGKMQYDSMQSPMSMDVTHRVEHYMKAHCIAMHIMTPPLSRFY